VQNGNYSVDFFFTDQIFLEQFVQEPVRRQFFHFDGVLDNAAWCFEGETGISLVDWNSLEINFWAQPSIQFDLALAKVAAFFQCAEIEKAEIHRLFHFEDKWRCNEDPPNVGLNRALQLACADTTSAIREKQSAAVTVGRV